MTSCNELCPLRGEQRKPKKKKTKKEIPAGCDWVRTLDDLLRSYGIVPPTASAPAPPVDAPIGQRLHHPFSQQLRPNYNENVLSPSTASHGADRRLSQPRRKYEVVKK